MIKRERGSDRKRAKMKERHLLNFFCLHIQEKDILYYFFYVLPEEKIVSKKNGFKTAGKRRLQSQTERSIVFA